MVEQCADVGANDVVDADLSSVPTERLEAAVQTGAALLAAETCRWLLQVAELDRREAWASWECRSMAHWLSWKCALSPRAARDQVRVARELERLPRARAEFAAGRLSYSKVRALTRLVAQPEMEADLVELAIHTTAAQLDVIAAGCARVRRLNDPGREEHDHDERRLAFVPDDDGTGTITMRGPIDLLLELMSAVDAAVDACAANDGEEIEARRFDAALELGRRYLEPDPDAVPAAAIVIRTEADTTSTDETIAAYERPAVLRRLPISRAAYERLRCDAKFAVERALDDGSIERTPTTDPIPRRVRRAVRNRDLGCCRWPGCGARASLHLHHIVYRSRSGPNSIDNIVSLCHFHHRAVHHRGWTIIGDANGPLRFVHRSGREADERTYRRAPVRTPALDRGPFDQTTIATALGDRLDRTWAINTVCHNEEILHRRN